MLENIYLKFVEHVITTFVICSVFIDICLFLLQKPASALVTSRLDYCNSLFHNVAIKDIIKLLCFKHCLARVVTRSPRFIYSKSPIRLYIGFLSDIVSSLISVSLLTRLSYVSSDRVYILCLLL